MSVHTSLDNFSQNYSLTSDISVQNHNNYVHVSIPPKIVAPRFNWDREKCHQWNVNKPRETVKEYKKLFRAKKQIPSRVELCNTQKCIQEIVQIVSLADNHCTSSENSFQESNDAEPNVTFDYNNPQMLDIQGIDQMQTYRKDEQDIQEKREYAIMKRELDKRRLFVEEKERFEQQMRDERFKLPDLFNIDIDPVYGGTSTSNKLPESVNDEESLLEQESVTSDIHRDVKLYRTKDKPKNRAIIEAEMDRRVANLQDRFMKMWEKEKQAEKERLEIEKKTQEELSATIAQQDFESLYKEKKVEEIFIKPPDPPPPVQYPNTFKELRSFRRKLNRIRREARDKCIVRETVFQGLGKQKFCVEKFLDADNISDDVDSMSPQSSDGEDGLEMGYKNSREFLVRGMHDRLSHEPRGMFLNRGKDRTTKSCLNREEWIQSTFNDCQRKKSLRKIKYQTKDIMKESYYIFHRKWKYVKPQNVTSPVKEYIEKGSRKILEISTKTKIPKFKHPKYIKVKTFNLTDYLYGSRKDKERKLVKDDPNEQDDDEEEKNELLQRLKKLEIEEENHLNRIRLQRMKHLGFSCSNKKRIVKTKPIQSDSDSDWLPDPEPLDVDTVQNRLKSNALPLQISNMKAPEFREPTLRRHPRRPRKESLNDIHVKDSRAPLNVARLQKMDYDDVRQSNLTEEKKDLNKHFKYRHHHDHLDHTQQKMVRVKYIPKMQKFNETFNANHDAYNIKTPEKDNSIVDFPVKSTDVHDWSRYFPVSTSSVSLMHDNTGTRTGSQEVVTNVKELKLNEQDEEKSRFHEKIQSSFKQHVSEATGESLQSSYEYPNTQTYRQQILDEQASAESCLSSVTSSVCTNFTNDSGSFFIITDTKVPMDYLMKHEVPFARMTENHRHAKLIEKEDEYHAPYLTVANAGQQIEMREICVPKDKFYTQVTRERAGIRDRLQVEHVKLENQLIGYEDEKYKPRFG